MINTEAALQDACVSRSCSLAFRLAKKIVFSHVSYGGGILGVFKQMNVMQITGLDAIRWWV